MTKKPQQKQPQVKKVSVQELKKLVTETILEEINKKTTKTKFSEGVIGPAAVKESGRGVNWDELRLLHGRNKLTGSWRVIMTALAETGEDKHKAVNLLKIALAKLQKNLEPAKENPQPTEDELLDFSKLL